MAGLHLLFLCTETAALLLSPPGRSLTLVMAGRWAGYAPFYYLSIGNV